MPSSFKRIGEKFRQALGMSSGNKDWRPTSNARNEIMVKEARKFSLQLKALHKDLTGLDKAVDTGLETMRGVLTAQLPRAYDETTTGLVPSDKEERIVGVNVNIDGISSANAELKQRLQEEVLHPLEQWLSAYRSIKERNKRVEQLRLDLDTKRRETMALHEKYQKLKAKEHKDAESTGFRAQTEEDKMHRHAQRYAEAEAEVFNALLTLIRDTAVLREYAAAALAIIQRCFTLAYTSFDLSSPVPMPMLPPPAVPTTGFTPVSVNAAEGAGAAVVPAGYLLGANTMRTSTASLGSGGGAYDAHATMHHNQAPPAAGRVSTNSSAGGYGAGAATSLAPPSPNAEVSSAVVHKPMPVLHPVSHTPQPSISHADLPPAPAWYAEARLNATPPVYDDDSDDDMHPPIKNPFKVSPDPVINPFHRPSDD